MHARICSPYPKSYLLDPYSRVKTWVHCHVALKSTRFIKYITVYIGINPGLNQQWQFRCDVKLALSVFPFSLFSSTKAKICVCFRFQPRKIWVWLVGVNILFLFVMYVVYFHMFLSSFHILTNRSYPSGNSMVISKCLPVRLNPEQMWRKFSA